MAVRFMASAIASSTRLTTNSPVTWMLRVVSLGVPSVVVLQAEHDQRRVLREHVEERERRGIDDAARAQRRHQRDRARHDQAAQQLVALARREIGELQAEIGH